MFCLLLILRPPGLRNLEMLRARHFPTSRHTYLAGRYEESRDVREEVLR